MCHLCTLQRSLVYHVRRRGEGIIDVPLALAELMIFTLTVGHAVLCRRQVHHGGVQARAARTSRQKTSLSISEVSYNSRIICYEHGGDPNSSPIST